MRSLRVPLTLAMVLASILSTFAHADTVASFTVDTGPTGAPNYLGEAFFAGGFTTFNNITFTFFTPSGADYAVGTGYLFSTPYTGNPAGLSSSDPGFLGSATAAGGIYTFSSSLEVTSGTEYFFYENALAPTGAIAGGVPGPGDAEYLYSTGATSDFVAQPISSADFLVTGSPVSTVTPEPSSFILWGTALLGVVSCCKKRRETTPRQ